MLQIRTYSTHKYDAWISNLNIIYWDKIRVGGLKLSFWNKRAQVFLSQDKLCGKILIGVQLRLFWVYMLIVALAKSFFSYFSCLSSKKIYDSFFASIVLHIRLFTGNFSDPLSLSFSLLQGYIALYFAGNITRRSNGRPPFNWSCFALWSFFK